MILSSFSVKNGVMILALNGSPRKNGNTELLLDSLLKGAGSHGADIVKLDVCRMRISPCLGCGKCERQGRCTLDDEMSRVYPLLEKTHHVVVATPVYFYGVTAQLKAFVDRCQVLWSRKYVLGNPAPPTVNGKRRKGHLLAIAGSSGKRVFEGVILTVRIFFDALNVEFGETLLARGIDKKGAILEEEALLRKSWELGGRLARGT